MPKNFIRKTYERWIKKNRKRFRFSPWITESRRDSFTLCFRGITSEVTCRIAQEGRAEVFVIDRQGQYWDIVQDFDIVEKRTPAGKYYCGLCEPPTHYSTRSLLWEDHVFEALLSWTNNWGPETMICLYGTPEKTSWGAELIKKTDLERRGNFDRCFPLIVRKSQ